MSLTRTWYTVADFNIPAQPDDTSLRKYFVWGLKAMLCQNITSANNGPNGAPPVSAKWTVEGSSDSVTAGMDAVDRWGTTFDATKIVNDGYSDPRSWIVLKGPGVTPFYVLIAAQSQTTNTPDYTRIHISWSTAAFTGGTTTVLPSNTKPFGYATTGTSSGAIFCDSASLSGSWRLNFVTSAAGHHAYIIVKNGGGIAACQSFLSLWPVKGHVSDQTPYIGILNFLAAGSAKANPVWLTNNWTRGYLDSGQSETAVVYPVAATSSTQPATDRIQSINPVSSKWDEWPTGVVGLSTGFEVYRGQLEDVGFLSSAAPLGTTWPVGGPVERVNIGGMLIPMGYPPTL